MAPKPRRVITPNPDAAAIEAVPGVVRDTRAHFESGATRSVEWRQRQLDGIVRLCREREDEIEAALREDLGKPPLEAYSAEISFTANEASHARKHLAAWMKPERVPTSMLVQPGTSRIVREPLGVVLVVAPWNYPFQLAVGPLVGALAAGNCAILKPSEVAPATSALLARRLPEYLDPDAVKVVEGGVPVSTALLAERFDHVFYTGNGTVGRIVMEAAAKHLTPVTLELGGKSPCLVDEKVDLDVAVKRIALGKWYNAGQTCVAPDYVLVHRRRHDELLDALSRTIRDFYGEDPQKSPDYGRVVNERHLRRLTALLPGGRVVTGGKVDEADRYLAPTVLRDVPPDAPVMADEIFGPILPVLPVEDMDQAIAFVNARPKPLALYVFSSDRDVQERVLSRTSSGGAAVNHIWLHLAVPGLPFGGVGPSGMGAYHGRHSFELFSHRKSVLRKPTFVDPPLMYPPYTPTKQRWLKRLL